MYSNWNEKFTRRAQKKIWTGRTKNQWTWRSIEILQSAEEKKQQCRKLNWASEIITSTNLCIIGFPKAKRIGAEIIFEENS